MQRITSHKEKSVVGRLVRPLALAVLLVFGAAMGMTGSPSLEIETVWAQQSGAVPGGVLGNTSDAELWRKIRRGVEGSVTIPDKKAGVLVSSGGDNWRAFRNGPISTWGGWALLGVFVVLIAYFVLHGRIRVNSGLSGRTVERFNAIERFSHWLTASSFVVLGLTGLNVMYGRYVIQPVLGSEAFATLTYWGKLAHNYVGFAFMVGLALMIVFYIKNNMPVREDLTWLAKGGGMFSKGAHPPAGKINAGQKILFWLVVIGGVSISLTGLALIFPFQIALFEGTFGILNLFGFGLPTELSMTAETQLSQAWHAIMGLALVVLIIAHVYLGTIGMEGAFDAMYTGEVDENWAKEHHNKWAKDLGLSDGSHPAE